MPVDPVTAAMVGTSVASGIAQYLNSREAASASKAELQKISNLLDKVQNPSQQWTDLSPEEYKVVQQYAPQSAKFIEEKAPQLVTRSQAGDTAMQAQVDALKRYKQLSEGGPDLQSQILQEQALKNSAIQNQGQQASILQGMERRGMGGSGLELQAALGAQQNAALQGSNASQNAAMDAYKTRLDALRQSAAIGQDVAGQDLNLQDRNAGIINAANQRAANRQQDYQNYLAGQSNEAQKYNMGQNQSALNSNVENANNFAKMNQVNRLQGTQQNYQNALDKIRIQSGQAQQLGQNYMSGARDTNQAIQGVSSGINAGIAYGSRPTYGQPQGQQTAQAAAPGEKYDGMAISEDPYKDPRKGYYA